MRTRELKAVDSQGSGDPAEVVQNVPGEECIQRRSKVTSGGGGADLAYGVEEMELPRVDDHY